MIREQPLPPTLPLAGRVAVVTAGASGIGFAIARRFIVAGARVAICDVDAMALQIACENVGVHGFAADVSRSEDVRRLIDGVMRWSDGHLDVLINNAGIGGPRAEIEAISDEDWCRTLNVNLSGAFYCLREVVPIMKRSSGGAIINISTSSVRTGLPMRLPYIASKAGLMGMTLNAARELGRYNIRVNAILPGLVRNERGMRLCNELAAERGISAADAEAEMLRFVSMRSWVDMDEIGDAAVYLASDAARHVSGQFLGVDGHLEWEI
jgi:NAD(P)-dependent dehydrogenase (short-subunit alcohol dehydrogenase family)